MSKKTAPFNRTRKQVEKGILFGLLFSNLGGPAKANEFPATVAKTNKITATTQNKDKFNTPIKIQSQADIDTLFEYALPIIFSELILEEVPMKNTYDDYGKFKGTKNTIGTGSTYSPINMSNYTKTDISWYHLANNPKTFSARTVSYENMLQLVIGWGKYRTKTQNPTTKKFIAHKTVLEQMFTQLQGAELKPCEFSALYCAVYNNENNITKLLPSIKQNYKNKIKCANLIRTWWQTTARNAGTPDRCLFEALVFLNQDGFCNAMLDMPTCPSARASCINTRTTTKYQSIIITTTNCTATSNACKTAYLSIVYRGNVVTPKQATAGLGRYFVIPLTSSTTPETGKLQKDYEIAIQLYNQNKYEQALKAFLDLQKRGADGADLLNDIAITYMNLKQYDKCISVCRDVLTTGQHTEYAKACYNAGKAYDAKRDYSNALKNYQKALEYYDTYGITNEDPSVQYRLIYQNAIKNANQQLDSIQNANPVSKQNSKKRKSSMLYAAGLLNLKKRQRKSVQHTRSKLFSK